MASVNFSNGKLKDAGHAKAIFRHCDSEQRLQHEHSNGDINKAETHLNTDLKGLSYSELCASYDSRIAFLDSQEGANKRKDRVTCFSLDIPVPEDLDETEEEQWFQRVGEILTKQYGNENFLDMKIHRDEIHDYTDAETGEVRTSRVHGHAFIIPEHEGKLNGKWFSRRSNINWLNDSIHEMSLNEFDCEFMDGTKMKSKKRVERMKFESERREIKENWQSIRKKEGELNSRKSAIKEQEDKTQKEWETASNERKKAMELQLELQNRINSANEREKEADKKISEAQKKEDGAKAIVKRAGERFDEAFTELITNYDEYINGLWNKKRMNELVDEPPLNVKEEKQLKQSKAFRKVLFDIAEEAQNENDHEFE